MNKNTKANKKEAHKNRKHSATTTVLVPKTIPGKGARTNRQHTISTVAMPRKSVHANVAWWENGTSKQKPRDMRQTKADVSV